MIVEQAICVLMYEKGSKMASVTYSMKSAEYNYVQAIATAIDLAVEALEKQIPKKPIQDEIQDFRYVTKFTCPACCSGFTGRISNYCYHCGQALNWSDC